MALISDAAARDVPVLGHCLGGQLLAKALGGSVGPAPVRGIGWGRVEMTLNLVQARVRGGRREVRRSLTSPGAQPPKDILATPGHP